MESSHVGSTTSLSGSVSMPVKCPVRLPIHPILFQVYLFSVSTTATPQPKSFPGCHFFFVNSDCLASQWFCRDLNRRIRPVMFVPGCPICQFPWIADATWVPTSSRLSQTKHSPSTSRSFWLQWDFGCRFSALKLASFPAGCRSQAYFRKLLCPKCKIHGDHLCVLLQLHTLTVNLLYHRRTG